MKDSNIANNGGTGRVDPAKLRKLEDGWGKMTEKQRTDAMAQLEDLTRGLSPAHQEAYRNYFRNLANADAIQRP